MTHPKVTFCPKRSLQWLFFSFNESILLIVFEVKRLHTASSPVTVVNRVHLSLPHESDLSAQLNPHCSSLCVCVFVQVGEEEEAANDKEPSPAASPTKGPPPSPPPLSGEAWQRSARRPRLLRAPARWAAACSKSHAASCVTPRCLCLPCSTRQTMLLLLVASCYSRRLLESCRWKMRTVIILLVKSLWNPAPNKQCCDSYC